ncbi:MAG: hypothetical protein ACI4IJ_04060 [Acutalibacteraceae bacterium]
MRRDILVVMEYSVLVLIAAASTVLKNEHILMFCQHSELFNRNAKSRPGYFPGRLFVVSA